MNWVNVQNLSAVDFAQFPMAQAQDYEELIKKFELQTQELTSFRANYRDVIIFPDGLPLDTPVTVEHESEGRTITEAGTIEGMIYESGDQESIFFAQQGQDRKLYGMFMQTDATFTFSSPQEGMVVRSTELVNALE